MMQASENEKCEEKYMFFLNSSLTFHLYMLKQLHFESDEKVRRQLEKSLVNSLSNLWKMHCAIFSLSILYKKANKFNSVCFSFNRKKCKQMLSLLKKVKLEIEKLSFTKTENKRLCLHYLVQMCNFYYEKKKNAIIIEPCPRGKPWISDKVFSNFID